MAAETKKLLDPSIKLTATAVRVPVFVGHSEAVNVEFKTELTADEAREVLRDAPEVGGELQPVGKAYSGITDEEVRWLDGFVRRHTVQRFGPVREVAYGHDAGLVLEIAFEGVQRSTRHKSGVAMRLPRVSRIRWDKPPAEADRIDVLERILARGEKEIAPGRTLEEDA